MCRRSSLPSPASSATNSSKRLTCFRCPVDVKDGMSGSRCWDVIAVVSGAGVLVWWGFQRQDERGDIVVVVSVPFLLTLN